LIGDDTPMRGFRQAVGDESQAGVMRA
jgi:hypothetical protein